ncbi:hypothetical protein F4680DRAFT_368415 [Xylaria scruposa]|nr:hypothetical protein F4680DRAFT_368415 [Xylaria scruposa]
MTGLANLTSINTSMCPRGHLAFLLFTLPIYSISKYLITYQLDLSPARQKISSSCSTFYSTYKLDTRAHPYSSLSLENTSRRMCDYTQIEYNCQHFRFVVLRWCPKYERTYKPCAPNVTHLEVRNDELCCM